MNATFRMARLYVNHCGFSVLPLWYKQKRRMFAGTTFQERPPTLAHLQHWFTGNPANIAIVPGTISDNLVILDFDDWPAWTVFHSLTGWSGPVVKTARGVHVYVRVRNAPDRNGQGYFEGLHFGEIITRGAITAPPSVHPSGHAYRWIGSPVGLPFLTSLADIDVECRSHQGVKKNFTRAEHRKGRENILSSEAYVSAAIRGECHKILTAVKGSRHNQLYESALKLAKYTDMTAPTEITHHLQAAARQAGLEAGKARSTIYRGLSQGRSNGVL